MATDHGELRPLYGDGDRAAGPVDDWDPDVWAWLDGVDYGPGWRAARNAAEEVNALLAACGVARSELRAVAETDAQGRGWVRLLGAPQGWQALEHLLLLAGQPCPFESS